MELLSKQDYYNSLPKKPMGAGVLFFNEQNELLIVKPNYKEYWLVPGGSVEVNESPKDAAIREVKEELGLDIEIDKLLTVSHSKTLEGDNLKFIFSGGLLSSQQISQIELQEEELVEFAFVAIEIALEMLGTAMSARLPFCVEALENGSVIYLENEEKI